VQDARLCRKERVLLQALERPWEDHETHKQHPHEEPGEEAAEPWHRSAPDVKQHRFMSGHGRGAWPADSGSGAVVPDVRQLLGFTRWTPGAHGPAASSPGSSCGAGLWVS